MLHPLFPALFAGQGIFLFALKPRCVIFPGGSNINTFENSMLTSRYIIESPTKIVSYETLSSEHEELAENSSASSRFQGRPVKDRHRERAMARPPCTNSRRKLEMKPLSNPEC